MRSGWDTKESLCRVVVGPLVDWAGGSGSREGPGGGVAGSGFDPLTRGDSRTTAESISAPVSAGGSCGWLLIPAPAMPGMPGESTQIPPASLSPNNPTVLAGEAGANGTTQGTNTVRHRGQPTGRPVGGFGMLPDAPQAGQVTGNAIENPETHAKLGGMDDSRPRVSPGSLERLSRAVRKMDVVEKATYTRLAPARLGCGRIPFLPQDCSWEKESHPFTRNDDATRAKSNPSLTADPSAMKGRNPHTLSTRSRDATDHFPTIFPPSAMSTSLWSATVGQMWPGSA